MRPRNEDELVAAVRRAVAAGRRLKALGTGSSKNGLGATDGTCVRLDHFTRIEVDRAGRRVTVGAGLPLAFLADELLRHGLAVPGLPDDDTRSVGGAVAAAAHGSGHALGLLASRVERFRLVCAGGEVREASPEADAELLAAGRVGLGALGVVFELSFSCVDAFAVHAVETHEPLAAALEALDASALASDFFELAFVPHTGRALLRRGSRSERPLTPRSPWREYRDDVLLGQLLAQTLCRLGRARPSAIPRLAPLALRRRVDCVDWPHRILTRAQLDDAVQLEVAIPRAAAREALERVHGVLAAADARTLLPVEARFGAADDIPLSPAFGRDTCYVRVSDLDAPPPWLDEVERVLIEHEGRPHWGTFHRQRAETLARRYPEWERFRALRARLDPRGCFRNAVLDRVLGPIGPGGGPARRGIGVR